MQTTWKCYFPLNTDPAGSSEWRMKLSLCEHFLEIKKVSKVYLALLYLLSTLYTAVSFQFRIVNLGYLWKGNLDRWKFIEAKHIKLEFCINRNNSLLSSWCINMPLNSKDCREVGISNQSIKLLTKIT